jgi:hypothetical protein
LEGSHISIPGKGVTPVRLSRHSVGASRSKEKGKRVICELTKETEARHAARRGNGAAIKAICHNARPIGKVLMGAASGRDRKAEKV